MRMTRILALATYPRPRPLLRPAVPNARSRIVVRQRVLGGTGAPV